MQRARHRGGADGATAPPCVTRERDRGGRGDAYTASARAHVVEYVEDEIRLLADAALRSPRLAAHGALARLALRWCVLVPLLVLVRVWGWLAAWAELDRCVFVNNWLLSTSLHPPRPPADADAAAALTAALTASLPDHALVYRSLDEHTSADLLAALRAAGWATIPARYVHFQRPADDAALWRRQAVKTDLKLAAKRLTPSGPLEWRELAADAPMAEYARCVELYELLYVGRYSGCNPRFTAAFVALAVRARLLTVLVLADASSGAIDGVLGYYARNGYLTCPLFGYDTAQPAAAGLYRLLSLKVLQEGRRLGVEVHASGGAAGFKRQRGAASAVEYVAVHDAHLPGRRRAAWLVLRALLKPLAALATQDAVGCAAVAGVTPN